MPIGLILVIIISIGISCAWMVAEIRGGLRLRVILGLLAIVTSPIALLCYLNFIFMGHRVYTLNYKATVSLLDATSEALKLSKCDYLLEPLENAKHYLNTNSDKANWAGYMEQVNAIYKKVEEMKAAQQGGPADAGTSGPRR